jgi:hypothetical protein
MSTRPPRWLANGCGWRRKNRRLRCSPSSSSSSSSSSRLSLKGLRPGRALLWDISRTSPWPEPPRHTLPPRLLPTRTRTRMFLKAPHLPGTNLLAPLRASIFLPGWPPTRMPRQTLTSPRLAAALLAMVTRTRTEAARRKPPRRRSPRRPRPRPWTTGTTCPLSPKARRAAPPRAWRP